MKLNYTHLSIFLVFLLLGCQSNQPRKITAPVSAEKKVNGKIEFLKEIHNFGTLKNGEVVSFTFVFKNKGPGEAQITGCENSCGCIDIAYDKNAIKPGAESGVEVIFNSAGEWGNQIKTIKLIMADKSEKQLTVAAYIENDNFNNLINN